MSFGAFACLIPKENLSGLRPRAWLCVGSGFSREDIKAVLLSEGRGFVGDAVTTLQDVARKIVSAHRLATGEGAGIPSDRVLGPLARQEILRTLLADRRIAAIGDGMPELKRLRRQSNFYRKLDLAVQAGRMAFAHFQEEEVYLERLVQRLEGAAERPVRGEIRILAAAYEAWLKGSELWDLPLLYSSATEVLSSTGWPKGFAKPEAIHVFSNQTSESREKDFCEALERHLELHRVGLPQAASQRGAFESQANWNWQRWHTMDDAAEALADRILEEVGSERDFSDHVILISDQAQVRRSLNRVLAERGIPQADPRDPTRIRWDEGIKWAMLPMEVVGRDYERSKVIAWLRAWQFRPEFIAWVNEIGSRGIRQGLRSYEGGALVLAHSLLSELQTELGGKKTCGDLAEAHLGMLRRAIGADPDRAWIIGFFEQVWADFCRDMGHLDQGTRRAPMRYWLERLQARVQESPAPVEPMKAVGGIAVYRVHQAPLVLARKVWILGLPPDWLSGEAAGDYWFSEREREILGAEFSVRSGIQVRQERLSALRHWVAQAETVTLMDALYDADGRERVSLATLLREVIADFGWSAELGEEPREGSLLWAIDHPVEPGAHERWLASYGALRPLQPQEVRLEPLPLRMGAEKPEITATALDRYSRCGFQGLAYHRWKLRDLREPDTELWPEVRGNILHQAVKHLLESRDADGGFALTPEQALERGWKEKPPKGLLKSRRIESYVKSRMLVALRVFCEKEREYFQRAGAKTIGIDDVSLRLEYPEFALVGTPDRIDATDDGLFIMDYKTASAFPSGTEMMELGYRLQLPFYALAAAGQLKKPVAGVQFIELGRKGTRSSGMFFKQYNGKESGKFTNVRSNSKSLLPVEPDEAWSKMEEQILLHARAMVDGRFDAKPKKKDKECDSCQLGDLCGVRRNIDPGTEAEGESE